MLTDIEIRKRANPKEREEISDVGKGAARGLRLVIQPSGAKSWALRYRFNGMNRKFTIGPYPTIGLADARRKAEEARGDIARGKDPAGEKKASREAMKASREKDSKTVENISTQFIDRYVKRSGKVGAGWGAEIERLFKVEINPKIGAKQIGEVKKRDISDLLDGIMDRGSPITANRTLAVLRRFFNWAVEREELALSPVGKMEAPAAENSRKRVLSDDEIRIAWKAFDAIGWPFGPIGKLLLLTAARRGEIAEARWKQIDLTKRTLTLPDPKNGDPHIIPLSDKAIEILETLPRVEGKAGFIFTTTGETPVSGFQKSRHAIDAAFLKTLRGEAEACGDDPTNVEAPERWTLHDLRRTADTDMNEMGIQPHVVDAILNHRSGIIKGVTKTYNRYDYFAEKKAALDAWARRLEVIVSGAEASNVVELTAARR